MVDRYAVLVESTNSKRGDQYQFFTVRAGRTANAPAFLAHTSDIGLGGMMHDAMAWGRPVVLKGVFDSGTPDRQGGYSFWVTSLARSIGSVRAFGRQPTDNDDESDPTVAFIERLDRQILRSNAIGADQTFEQRLDEIAFETLKRIDTATGINICHDDRSLICQAIEAAGLRALPQASVIVEVESGSPSP